MRNAQKCWSRFTKFLIVFNSAQLKIHGQKCADFGLTFSDMYQNKETNNFMEMFKKVKKKKTTL